MPAAWMGVGWCVAAWLTACVRLCVCVCKRGGIFLDYKKNPPPASQCVEVWNQTPLSVIFALPFYAARRILIMYKVFEGGG